jgi:hypothetical protein
MKLINEDCGCDDDYFSVINNSPLLSGSQENSFNPNNSLNNSNNNSSVFETSNNANNANNSNNANNANNSNNANNANNVNPIVFERAKNNNYNVPSINIDEIKQNKIIHNNIDMNNLQMNQPHQQMNQLQNQQMNQLQNQQMNQLQNQQMNNISNHMNNQMTNNQMSNNVYELEETKESSYKNIASTLNYILIVLLAIAINDLAKIYIIKAMKCHNGNHTYYLYYVGGLIIVIYLLNRMINKLN